MPYGSEVSKHIETDGSKGSFSDWYDWQASGKTVSPFLLAFSCELLNILLNPFRHSFIGVKSLSIWLEIWEMILNS